MDLKINNSVIATLIHDIKDFKRSFCNSCSDRSVIFLAIIYSALYLPHCFILNESINLLIAYKTDAGTISKAIIGLLDHYNFHDHMHSKYYGWTYFLINFLILKPVAIFLDIFGHTGKNEILLFGIKIIFFSIGLLSVAIFHELLKKIFYEKSYAFFGALTYVIGGVNMIFYSIHPETTGILFMLASLLCLFRLIENPRQYKFYLYGFLFLVLSSLSKQIFFFTSMAILTVFLTVIFVNKSMEFGKLTKHSLLIATTTLIIVNPFLIFDYKNGIFYQIELLNHHNTNINWQILSVKSLFEKWLLVLSSSPLVLFYFMSSIIVCIFTIFKISRNRTTNSFLFLAMIMSIYLVSLLIFIGNKLYVLPLYLAPIYPFFIIYFIVLMKYTRSEIVFFALSIYFSATLLLYAYVAPIMSYDLTTNHKKSIAHKSHEYLLKNYKIEDKIIYGLSVAMPEKIEKNKCSYWIDKNCLDKIPNPDYIMIDREYRTNGKRYGELQNLIDYAKENNMTLIHEIKINEDDDFKISIYKK